MLGVKLCNTELGNPTILASGILGTSVSLLKRVADSGAGAVTTKSIGPEPRNGNKNPSVLEWEHGLINAVGLPSPGYKAMGDELEQLTELGKPWIASIYGNSAKDYSTIASYVSRFSPDFIELNISCPNKKDGTVFATDEKLSKKLVSIVKRATSLPVIAKLTPNCANIAKIAKACEEGGADAINAINTALGMIIDIDTKRPVLAYKTGGISGSALKPIAVRCVYQIYQAVRIPIIGTGGITTGEDAIEMMMAGASAVGIGSAIRYRGISVFRKICNEMRAWLQRRGYKSVGEIIGIAHER
jgi:dihydroorotate dehydrogenase (NAD+) catalytic subunit